MKREMVKDEVMKKGVWVFNGMMEGLDLIVGGGGIEGVVGMKGGGMGRE